MPVYHLFEQIARPLLQLRPQLVKEVLLVLDFLAAQAVLHVAWGGFRLLFGRLCPFCVLHPVLWCLPLPLVLVNLLPRHPGVRGS